MREILFRGKRTDNGEWIEGYYRDLDGEHPRILKENIFIGKFGRVLEFKNIDVIPETVGQYTGLTNKNGVRIFEGDIVKADDYIFYIQYGKCGGVQNSDNFGYMGFYLSPLSEGTKVCSRYGLRDDICYFTNIEVIGNIHDNPYMLEEASKPITQDVLASATDEGEEYIAGFTLMQG